MEQKQHENEEYIARKNAETAELERQQLQLIPEEFDKTMTNEPINFDNIGARRYQKPTILVIDDDTADVLLLSHDKLKWLPTSIKSEPNKSGGIVSLDNEIYKFGGDILGKETYQLNQESMKWEERARMNSSRRNISNSSVAYAGCIWACGGLGKDSGYQLYEEVLNSVEKYDPKMRRWIRLPSMSEKRENAAAAVCGGKLFICGGWNGAHYLSNVEFIGTSEDHWMLFYKEVPSFLGRPAMAFDGMQLIVIGGGSFTEPPVVWGIEPFNAEVEWKDKKPVKATEQSWTAMSLENEIIAIAGEYVEIFDGKDWSDGLRLSNGSRKTALAITPYLAEILDESDRGDLWKKNLITEKFRIKQEKFCWPDYISSILVFGGQGSRNMYILNKNAVEWIQLELQSPGPVFMGGAVFFHYSIYIFGGDLGKKTYRLGGNGSNWIPCAEMTTTRRFISNSSVVFQKEIWVLGGRNDTEGTLDTVEKYDYESNTWKIMSSMNIKRENAAAAPLCDKIIVCGGSNGGGPLNCAEFYDPAAGEWYYFGCLDLQSPRSGHVLLPSAKGFFLMGGPGDDVFQVVVTYNQVHRGFVTNFSAWTPHGRMLRSRTSFTAALLNGKPHAIGGIGLNDVELYDQNGPVLGPDLPNECFSTPSLSIPFSFFLQNTLFPSQK